MVGILISFWDGLFSGAFAVSFRECNQHLQPTHRKGRVQTCLSRRIFVNFSQSVAKLWNKWRTGSRMTKAPKGGMRSITAAQFVWWDNGEYIPLKFKVKGKRIDPWKIPFWKIMVIFKLNVVYFFLITCFRIFGLKTGREIRALFKRPTQRFVASLGQLLWNSTRNVAIFCWLFGPLKISDWTRGDWTRGKEK